MTEMNLDLGKYVDIKTNFGMKHYFGQEQYKHILIHFLNSLFLGERTILNLQYRPTEQDADYSKERGVLFDLYCIDDNGAHFIIEMQQYNQDFFKDRALYYSARLINKLIPKGKEGNSYELPVVYFIAILTFNFSENNGLGHLHDVILFDRLQQTVFYKKLNYKLIILPKFLKKETELETDLDHWLFLFQNLGKLTYTPDFLDKQIFQLIFEIGEIAKLNKEDRMAYETLFKNKRDERSILATAKRIAREEGEQKGLEKAEQLITTEKKSVIQNLINQLNLSNKEIANLTNTDIRFVQHIRLAMKK